MFKGLCRIVEEVRKLMTYNDNQHINFGRALLEVLYHLYLTYYTCFTDCAYPI
jgi:hypothetical protein